MSVSGVALQEKIFTFIGNDLDCGRFFVNHIFNLIILISLFSRMIIIKFLHVIKLLEQTAQTRKFEDTDEELERLSNQVY